MTRKILSLKNVIRATVTTSIATVAALAVWASVFERTRYTVRRHSLAILPEGSVPIRLLHVSDIHLAPWQHDKMDWIRSLAESEKPDLIVNTGDNLGHEDAFTQFEHVISAFGLTPAVYVTGSNDYFGPVFKNPLRYFIKLSRKKTQAKRLDTARLHRICDRSGWKQLNNTSSELTVKGTRILFFGVDDPHHGLDSLTKMRKSLAENSRQKSDRRDNAENTASEKVSGKKESGEPQEVGLRIGVSHAPYTRILDALVDDKADAIFSGHTHGGQVCVPGFGALVTNCDIPRELVKGSHTWTHNGRSASLNISAGVGTSIFAPVRFACPPEVSVITLTPKNAKPRKPRKPLDP